ncbi:class I SAM-dependent methyltransferase [Dehalococcoidia bacterium]|nr:class I SAM-dependent methyltransferase [Dehalococcoidia bacterium]
MSNFAVFFLIILLSFILFDYLLRRYKFFKQFKKTREKYTKINIQDVLVHESENQRFLEEILTGWSAKSAFLYLSRYEKVVELINDTPSVTGAKILDVGCGDGYLLERVRKNLALHNENLFGVDISSNRIKFAKRRNKDIPLFVADAENLPFKDGMFDLVMCTATLEHLFHPINGINEITRVLRSGGKAIISTPSKHMTFLSVNPLTWFEAILSIFLPWVLPKFHNLEEPNNPKTIVHRAFTIVELQGLFKEYSNVEITSVIFPIPFLKFLALMQRKVEKTPVLNKLGRYLIVRAIK